MSSAIGNYIHYSNKGYQTHGLTQNGKPKGKDQYGQRMSVLEAYKKQFKIQSSNKGDIKGLEKFLNALLYPSKEKSKMQIDSDAFQSFQSLVSEAFSQKWSGFNIDMKDLHIYQMKQINENTTSISSNTLSSYGQTLQKMIENLGKNSDISQEVEKIKNTVAQIENLVKQSNPDAKIDLSNQEDLINNINEALALSKFNLKMLGDAFEIWLSAASQIADYNKKAITKELIENTIKDINQGVQGGKSAQSIINLSKISADFVDKEVLKKTFSDANWSINDSIDVATKSSQQKTDIVFNWKGSNLYVSAKNYSLKDENASIHLLSGTSLLQILLSCDINYANHFLNIVGTGDSALQQAHNNLKTIILAKALSGQDLKKTGLADTFVINARSKKHIYVFTMKQLFEAYSQIPEKISIGNSLNIKQTYSVNGPQERITNLLASLHAEKLKVSITANEIIK